MYSFITSYLVFQQTFERSFVLLKKLIVPCCHVGIKKFKIRRTDYNVSHFDATEETAQSPVRNIPKFKDRANWSRAIF